MVDLSRGAMFGDLVRAHRVRLGLTQEDLAERAGLSPRSIRSIENGRTTRARASTVRLLATAFDLDGPERDAFCATAGPEAARTEGEEEPRAERTEPIPAASPVISAPPTIRPCQLPPDLPDYTYSAATVVALGHALTTPAPGSGVSPTVVISGRGGAGKTSMAVHIAHRMADQFPDGQLFVSLRGTQPEPATTADALARALRGLGDAGPPSTSLEEWVDRYRAQLASRRVLVVLDDAAGAAQVRPFLPTGPGNAVLVTTRARLTTLAGVHRLELDLMGEADAVRLLEQILGSDRISAEPEQVRILVRQCDRLPLALRVVGARLAARPHWPIARLVARMSDERRRLDELAIDDLAVRAGLAVSYRGLDSQGQRALRALAYLDPPDFAVWTMAALLDVDLIEAEDVVEQLLDRRLVDVVALGGLDTRYRLHSLVRLYARERAVAVDKESDLRLAVSRAVHLGLYQVDRRSEQLAITVPRLYQPQATVKVNPAWVPSVAVTETNWFEAEEASLVAAVERTAELGLADLACALADALIFASFAVRNNFTGWERAHRAALVVARSSKNVHAEAVIECGLGQLRYKEDRFADSKRHFERALSLFRLVNDHRGETAAMNGLGTVCRERGELAAALTLQSRAGEDLERLGDQEGAAHAYYGMGFVHRELGNDERAIECLNQGLELYQRINHVRGQAISVRGIGLVYRARDELEAAELYCARAHDLALASGDQLLSTYTAQALAKVWIRQGAPERAAAPLEQGIGICTEWQDRFGIAMILRTLGEMHLASGDPSTAVEELDKAYRAWGSLELELWQARTLVDLGAAHILLGDGPAGHQAWAQAQITFDRFGTRERTEMTAWRSQWGCSCSTSVLLLNTDCGKGATVVG